VIVGLEESGYPDLATALAWATIKTFHANYREFALPSSGRGAGAKWFSWTAAQYIQAVIDHLFGVNVEACSRRILISPHIPRDLYGKNLALENLLLPNGGRLSVHIRQSASTRATMVVEVTSSFPEGRVVVSLPGTSQERSVLSQPHVPIEFR
jgi:cellobiose phosphorylase